MCVGVHYPKTASILFFSVYFYIIQISNLKEDI